MKSLDTILNEYVQIKEAEIKRKQFAEANPLVNDLLAVIDRHAGRPASQPNEMPLLAEAQHNQQSHQTVGTSRQEDTIIDTANVQACQQPMARVASTAAEQNATPMCQKPPLPLPAIASRHPSSSQHRKGAPRRRVEQNNKVRSPISRVTVPAPGVAFMIVQTTWQQTVYCNVGQPVNSVMLSCRDSKPICLQLFASDRCIVACIRWGSCIALILHNMQQSPARHELEIIFDPKVVLIH